jgi:UDP-3-O-[3-hydroxymyristoyl] glucosamine N-acyltransferase
MPRLCRFAVMLVAASAWLATPALAEQNSDQVHIGRDIYVEPQDKAGDLVCVACSIHIRGQATGDAVAIGGSVVLEQGAQVAGGVTTVVGDIRLQAGTQIGGDVVAIAGTVRRDPQSTISGDVTSLGGAGWTLLILVTPLVVLGGFVTLIIWLFQRKRPVAPAPA